MSLKDRLDQLVKSNVFLFIAAVMLGYIIFSVFPARPEVGIIKLSGTIDEKTTDNVVQMLRFAKERDEIKAVVLAINSPGGSASLSEEIYLSVISLKAEKPVVASIDQIGASGAYYAAIGANYIYAKPTSIVGSVGVVTRLPTPERLEEDAIASGPLKELGSTRKDWAYQSKLVGEIFLNAVMLQRAEKLKISREELASGGVYIGIEGLKRGLVDEIGSTENAIEKAAKLARIKNYKILDINKELNITESIQVLYVNETFLKASTNTAPAYYYLYIEDGGMQ